MREDEETLRCTSAGFVTFTSVATANAASQTLLSSVPNSVEAEMAPEPREVYWKGVGMTPPKRTMGAHIVTLLKIPLVWFYIVAILFIASMQNLDSLSALPGLGWLSFVGSLPAVVRGLLQGLLPVILLAVLMGLLPKILRNFAKRAGVPSESAIQSYVFGTHYVYQVGAALSSNLRNMIYCAMIHVAVTHSPSLSVPLFGHVHRWYLSLG